MTSNLRSDRVGHSELYAHYSKYKMDVYTIKKEAERELKKKYSELYEKHKSGIKKSWAIDSTLFTNKEYINLQEAVDIATVEYEYLCDVLETLKQKKDLMQSIAVDDRNQF